MNFSNQDLTPVFYDGTKDGSSPYMGGSTKGSLSLADFECNSHGRIIRCLGAQAPVSHNTKKDRHSVSFAPDSCSTCPHRSQCPIQEGKKNYYLRYTGKALRIDRRRKSEHTDEFINKYRYRSGVEATMSEYNTLTGRVKRLRVRDMKAVRYCATLKAIGVNIFRATAVRKALIPSSDDFPADRFCFFSTIFHIGVRFGLVITRFMKYPLGGDQSQNSQPLLAR